MQGGALPDALLRSGPGVGTVVKPLHRIALIAVAAVIAAALGEFASRAIEPMMDRRADAAAQRRPLIGGPFELIDHAGRTVTERTYLGKVQLVFFGFTNCPDVCPTALGTMTDLLDRLGADAASVQPILISVDPERDTAERLADYVTAFHPSLIALTGQEEAIMAAARAFGVYFKKAPSLIEGEYSVDHSSTTFVLDRSGRFFSALDPHDTDEAALDKLRRAIATAAPTS